MLNKANKTNPKNRRNLGAKAKQRPQALAIPAGVSVSRKTQNPDMVIGRTEFVGSFLMNHSGFKLLPEVGAIPGFDLNPGNSVLFPWLSGIAKQYEKYEFLQLDFELIPGNPTTRSGRMYMALDYDWDDPVPTSAVDLMQNVGAVEGSVWEPLRFQTDIRLLNSVLKERYVLDVGRVEATPRFIYAGYLMVGSALTSEAIVFDVRVHYSVKLSNPCLPPQRFASSSVAANLPLRTALPTPIPLPRITSLPVVQAGINGIPPIYGVHGVVPEIYSLRNAASGILQLIANYGPNTASAKTPADVVQDTWLDCSVLDEEGNNLTALSVMSADLAPQFVRYGAARDDGTWEVVGGMGTSQFSIDLGWLRKTYPTMAYLFPYLFSGTGFTLNGDANMRAAYSV